MLEILEERKFSIEKIIPVASKKSEGTSIDFNGKKNVRNVCTVRNKKIIKTLKQKKLMLLKLILNGCLLERISQNLRYGESLKLVIYN